MNDNHPIIIDTLIEARQRRVREEWETTGQPGRLRRLVGQQMIRFGEWVEGDRQRRMAELETRANRRVVLS